MITKMLLVTRRAKMPLQGVFAFREIKSCGTPENAVQRIYIKYGNTTVRGWRTDQRSILYIIGICDYI